MQTICYANYVEKTQKLKSLCNSPKTPNNVGKYEFIHDIYIYIYNRSFLSIQEAFLPTFTRTKQLVVVSS